MKGSVLDASAILAAVNTEPGARVVVAALPGAIVSTVNLAEVISKLIEKGSSREQVRDILNELMLTTVDFDGDLAERCGHLRATTRAHGLSLGDRACLALAERMNLPALTGDHRWSNLQIGITIKMIR